MVFGSPNWHFLAVDFTATAVATVVFAAVIILPGAVIAFAGACPGWAKARTAMDRAGIALLCGVSIFPVLLDLAGRVGGPAAMLGLTLPLAAAGAFLLLRGARPDGFGMSGAGFLCFIVWAVFTTFLLVDWPTAEGLRNSQLMYDHVKHATATWAIADSGTPPYVPTFFTPGTHATYYYFFFNLSAVTQLVTGNLAEARHAVFAATIWMGPAVYLLARQVLARGGFQPGANQAAGSASSCCCWCPASTSVQLSSTGSSPANG